MSVLGRGLLDLNVCRTLYYQCRFLMKNNNDYSISPLSKSAVIPKPLSVIGPLLLLMVCQLFSAGSQAAIDSGVMPELSRRPDFAGAWEKDYARSDNWERQIRAKLAALKRAAEQRSRNGRGDVGVAGAQINLGGNSTNVIDLARFTELISRHNSMVIKQDENEIRIQREGEADLICAVSDKVVKTSNEFGSERCVWSGNRLIFKIQLNEGTEILHHLRVSADRKSMNMKTRVAHRGSSFELTQFFDYFDTPSNQYNCKQTISRGKVCNLRGSQSRGDQ